MTSRFFNSRALTDLSQARIRDQEWSSRGEEHGYPRLGEKAREAGLPEGRTPHGLRKAGSRLLAEGGAGAPQIGAVTGHKSLAEVERYIRSAQQKKLAKVAIDAASRVKAGT